MSAARNVWVMSGTVLFTLTAVFAWNRVLPNHLRQLGATESQVGLVFMILALAHRLPSVFGGLIADRVGRKRILVVATFLMAPMYALAGFMDSWVGVLVALGLAWFFSSFQGPSIITIVAEAVPEEKRGRAIGILETFIMAAVCLGPWVGGRIISWTGDFRHAMFLMLVATGVVYVFVGIARGTGLVETRHSPEPHAFRWVGWSSYGILLVVGVVVYAVFFLSTDGPFFPMYAKDVIRFSDSGVADAAFLGGLAAVPAAMLGGWISDRFGPPRVMIACFLGFFVMMVPFAWAWWRATPIPRFAPGLDLALYVFWFVPGEIFTIAFHKQLTSVAPKAQRALYVGLMGTVTGIFASLANLAGGHLYEKQGPAAPFGVGAACAAIGVVIAVVLWRRTRGAKPVAVPVPAAAE